MNRVSATTASRQFARLLDEVEHRGTSFVVERHGAPVAEISPPRRSSTVAKLRSLLREPAPDADWIEDLQSVAAARKGMHLRDPWNAS